GTAAYLSPEMAQGLPAQAGSDIYALGCVLYEMLTGEPPFIAETPVAVLYRHVNEEPTPPSLLERSVPAALDEIVMRSLAKDPNDRPSSAEEMAAALRSAAAASRGTPGGAARGAPAAGDTDTAPIDRPVPTAVLPVSAPPAGPRPPGLRWLPVALLAGLIVA